MSPARKIQAFDTNGDLQTVNTSEAILREYTSIFRATGERFNRNAYFLSDRAFEHCIVRWNSEPGWKFEAPAGGAQ